MNFDFHSQISKLPKAIFRCNKLLALFQPEKFRYTAHCVPVFFKKLANDYTPCNTFLLISCACSSFVQVTNLKNFE